MSGAERHPRCPEAVLAAIPWYPDGGLSEAERRAVETHAAGCAACRRELAWMRDPSLEPAPAAPDPERVFARVRARIDAEAQGPEPGRTRALRARSRRASAWRAARLAAGIAAALLIAAVAGYRLGIGEARYETASTPAAVASPPAAAMLDVVFRDDVSAAQLREALRSVGASIVSGPTPLGVYRLRLNGPEAVGEIAARLRAEETGVATFAEPVAR